MSDLDALCRGAAIGIALLLGLTFWRIRSDRGVAWIGSLSFAGAIAYELAGHQGYLTWPMPIGLASAILSLSFPFFFWALARLVFDDDFRLRAAHFLWLGLIEAAGLALFVSIFVVPGGPALWLYHALGLAFRLPSLALIAHALWVIWHGRPADLVEARARLRVVVLVAAGLAAALVLLAAILYGPVQIRPPAAKLGEAALLLLINLLISLQLMRIDGDFLPSTSRSAASAQPSSHTEPAAPAEIMTGGDADILARLTVLMSRDEVWREAGLTIGTLATSVGIPEYRLRRLINQRLGFRNFTAFVNEHRLGAAEKRLADPAQARIPVLTIALDLGWGSIGPFNRAFRARFDTSPSEYRRHRLGALAMREDGSPIPKK